MHQKICKWFQVCPIKSYWEQELIDSSWVEKYCKENWDDCVRYHYEKNNIPHPDNMLPNGELDERIR